VYLCVKITFVRILSISFWKSVSLAFPKWMIEEAVVVCGLHDLQSSSAFKSFRRVICNPLKVNSCQFLWYKKALPRVYVLMFSV
jgi:hypothetical protein